MRCWFNYSAQGMAKLGKCIARQGMAYGVANLITLPMGRQNLSGYRDAEYH